MLDLEAVHKDPEYQEATSAAERALVTAQALEVTDATTNAQALEGIAQCRNGAKRLEEMKQRYIKPLRDVVELIRKDFDAAARPLQEADRLLSSKTAHYREAKEEEARKEQARLRKLAEAKQERAVAKAERDGSVMPPVDVPLPVVAPPAKTNVTESGAKVTFRKVPKFEVTDPALVPKEFWCVDEKRIGAVVRAGAYTPDNPIPGVRIWYEQSTQVRG